ncbi:MULTISPECIES: sensor histidine kinase [unclassified Campylobacter]|uniref:sensor histidine kinase n=1 Tax=unclassified Campylobacter TaxID=2593542 RepID=UPI003D338113
MEKNLKIPTIAVIIIMALFALQSFWIIVSSQKEEVSNNIFGMMRFEKQVRRNFENGQILPDSLIYKYALYDSNDTIYFSTLQDLHKERTEKNFIKDGVLYYKDFFFLKERPFFIIIASELNVKREIFIVSLTLALALLVVSITIYLLFVTSVKPYKQAQKYLNDFFNDAMHELKTPLGVAKINLEMLGVENKNTKRISNALKQMQLLYDDVEYYIKRGYIKFPSEHINLCEFARERVRFLASLADTKRIKIVYDIEANLYVFISKIALQRLVDNTITNAIKYSPQDTKIILSIKKDEGRVVFSVEDFGSGIKDVKKIFRRYEREDSVQGGFGIGLNIVEEICVKNDIIYNVRSELEKGSKFSYKLKLASLS